MSATGLVFEVMHLGTEVEGIIIGLMAPETPDALVPPHRTSLSCKPGRSRRGKSLDIVDRLG